MKNDFNSIDFLQKSFWLFSVALFSRTNVEEACLCLRDKYNLNINLLFFCCWLANQKYPPLSERDVLIIIEKVSPWHDKIIKELNKLCQLFPKKIQNEKIIALQKTLSENETFARKAEQSILLQLLNSFEKTAMPSDISKTQCALKNIFNVLDSQNIKLHQTDLEKVYRIVKQCFAREKQGDSGNSEPYFAELLF